MCGVIPTFCSTDSSKNSVEFRSIMHFGCPSRFRICKKYARRSTLWLKSPSLRIWVWGRRKYIFTKDQSVKVKVTVRGHFLLTFWWFSDGCVIYFFKVPNRCAWGALGGLHGSGGGLLKTILLPGLVLGSVDPQTCVQQKLSSFSMLLLQKITHCPKGTCQAGTVSPQTELRGCVRFHNVIWGSVRFALWVS